jgi:hypothetical protein
LNQAGIERHIERSPNARPQVRDRMRSPFDWYVMLVAACVVGPYVFGIRPRGRGDWRWLAVTIGFLTWLLAGFASSDQRR